METFDRLGLEPLDRPAVLVASHGPFAWGPRRRAGGRERDRARGGGGRGAAHETGASRRHSDRRRPAPAALPSQARVGRVLRADAVEGAPPARRRTSCACTTSRTRRPRAGEVLVRVTAVGLCGSDRHWLLEGGIGDAQLEHPLVLGHEFAGVIVSGPREGERVAVDPAVPCGACEPCAAGLEHLCPAVRFAGSQPDRRRPAHAPPMARALAAPGARRSPTSRPRSRSRSVWRCTRSTSGTSVPAPAPASSAAGRSASSSCSSCDMAGASPIVATDLLAHRVAAAADLGATHRGAVAE